MNGKIQCPYCQQPARLTNGDEIYPHRADLGHKNFWKCTPCDAYVGCHDGTTTPLGRLADAELRKAKLAAHNAFDPIWRKFNGNRRRSARSDAYAWLSNALGIPPHETHIGMMDLAQCAKVVELCRARAAREMAFEMMGH